MVFPKFGEQELVRSPLNTHCSHPYIQLLAVGVNKEQREGEGKRSIDKHVVSEPAKFTWRWSLGTVHSSSQGLLPSGGAGAFRARHFGPGRARFGSAACVRAGCVSARAQVRFGTCSGAFRVRQRFPHGAARGAFSESDLPGASSESDLPTARSVPRIRFPTALLRGASSESDLPRALLRGASSESDLSTALPPTNPNP